MVSAQSRRHTDKLPMEIETMILEENDPKQRAFLIVLNAINNSLVANTDTIREVSSKLETHLTNFDEHTRAEDALLNKGRGAWHIVVWVIGVAQVIGLGIWQLARTDLAEINTSLQSQHKEIATHETRITVLERSK